MPTIEASSSSQKIFHGKRGRSVSALRVGMVSILPPPLVRRYKSAHCSILQTPMFGIHDFALFVTTGILLNLTPGPDTLYILGRSIAHGRRAGVASALGISVGSIFHTGAAALGLSA